jgi:transposase-like protein
VKRDTVDEKMAIVVSALSGEASLRSLCKRHGIAPSLLYLWRKRFLKVAGLPWKQTEDRSVVGLSSSVWRIMS